MDSVDHQGYNNADSTTDYNDMINSEAIEPKIRPKVHQLNYSENNDSRKSSVDINKATYNKYTDSPIQLSQVMSAGGDNNKNKNFTATHANNQPQTPPPSIASTSPTHVSSSSTPLGNNRDSIKSKALVIGTDTSNLDPVSIEGKHRIVF